MRQFDSRQQAALIEVFQAWTHQNVVRPGPEDRFRLGEGHAMGVLPVLALWERLLATPTPTEIIELEGRDRFRGLEERVLEAVRRLLEAGAADRDEREWATRELTLALEPFVYKVLALLYPEAFGRLAEGRSGLAAGIRALREREAIPYRLELTAEEFERPEGWEERTSYANAVRDAVEMRNRAAHEADFLSKGSIQRTTLLEILPEEDRRHEPLWQSIVVVMLGVVGCNQEALDDVCVAADEIEVSSRSPEAPGEESPTDESTMGERSERGASGRLVVVGLLVVTLLVAGGYGAYLAVERAGEEGQTPAAAVPAIEGHSGACAWSKTVDVRGAGSDGIRWEHVDRGRQRRYREQLDIGRLGEGVTALTVDLSQGRYADRVTALSGKRATVVVLEKGGEIVGMRRYGQESYAIRRFRSHRTGAEVVHVVLADPDGLEEDVELVLLRVGREETRGLSWRFERRVGERDFYGAEVRDGPSNGCVIELRNRTPDDELLRASVRLVDGRFELQEGGTLVPMSRSRYVF